MKITLKQTLLASVVAVTTAAQAEVNVVSWGGAYTASQQKAYQETYKDPGSINFINYNGGLGEVRTQVESGNVTWDIVDVLPSEARVGCDEGLFEELDRSAFKPAADGTSMDDDIMVEHYLMIASFRRSSGLMYRFTRKALSRARSRQRLPISSTSRNSPASAASTPGLTR